MKFIVALAALAIVAVAVDAAPISGTMPDTVSLSAADLTNTIAGVKKAEASLHEMVHIENEESNEMQAVSDTINMLPGHDASNDPASTKSEQQQVNMAAQKLSKLTKSADMDEFKQQAAAEKAKAQLDNVLMVAHGGQSELGEAQDPTGGKGGKGESHGESPLQQALAAIQQADTTLSKGSSTMNTEHELKHMEKEESQLYQESKQWYQGKKKTHKKTQLGESFDESEEKPGVGEDGALLKLQQARSEANLHGGKGSQSMDNLVAAETKELQTLMHEEADVAQHEKADAKEINGVIQTLN